MLRGMLFWCAWNLSIIVLLGMAFNDDSTGARNVLVFMIPLMALMSFAKLISTHVLPPPTMVPMVHELLWIGITIAFAWNAWYITAIICILKTMFDIGRYSRFRIEMNEHAQTKSP